ncbi:thermonuclease family protein [Mesorhizobium sp. YR577]|uniref:thermonuclease family protein n=1 Tax=Mesorhizobium sp. YR577 TaxID=1884373 RepID=UPI001AEC7869|nr:thermonuclease family protein [Mesorhizobium sp. YR577]
MQFSFWRLIAALIAVLFFCPDPGAAEGRNNAVGRASVVDGDTIEIHGERIRFNGIDAPEASQICIDGKGQKYRCGARAAEALAEFLSLSSPTHCEFVERDRYGRFVGNCLRADGTSIQEWLVINGYALDWPRYSAGAYAGQQKIAKSKRLGMWEGTFQTPWEWRAQKRSQAEPIAPILAEAPRNACDIKGNINAKGDRIYHMPGQEHYTRTKVSEKDGERWFCSEMEAQAAGWRAAKR